MTRGYGLALSIALAVGVSGGAQAAYVDLIQHNGTADPTTEGWSLHRTGSTTGFPENGYWKVVDDDTAGRLNYRFGLDTFDFSQGWAASVTTRVVSNSVTGDDPFSASFGVDDGKSYWLLSFVGGDSNPANDGVWLINDMGHGPATASQVVQLDTTDNFHNYTMVFDPDRPNAISFFLDDIFTAEILRSSVPDATDNQAGPIVLWGSGSTFGTGVAGYSSASFAELAPVPIPGAFGLLVSGLGFIAAIGRHRIKRSCLTQA